MNFGTANIHVKPALLVSTVLSVLNSMLPGSGP